MISKSLGEWTKQKWISDTARRKEPLLIIEVIMIVIANECNVVTTWNRIETFNEMLLEYYEVFNIMHQSMMYCLKVTDCRRKKLHKNLNSKDYIIKKSLGIWQTKTARCRQCTTQNAYRYVFFYPTLRLREGAVEFMFCDKRNKAIRTFFLNKWWFTSSPRGFETVLCCNQLLLWKVW